MPSENELPPSSAHLLYPQFGFHKPSSLLAKTEPQPPDKLDLFPVGIFVLSLMLTAYVNQAWIAEQWQLLLHHLNQ